MARRSIDTLAPLILAVCCPAALIAQTPVESGPTIYKIGKDVTAPRLTYRADPQFSEQAKAASYQGTVVLKVVVGTDGRAHDIRVINAIGMGLDEKAVEAVKQWRFDPGRKNGQPVPVEVAAEVDFHIYGPNDDRIFDLTQKANAGDSKAQFNLAHIYFEGNGVTRDDKLGESFLRKAASKGLAKAQFELGERLTHVEPPDYPNAYMWLVLAQRAGYKHSDKALKELSAKMTPDQQQKGQTLADNWTPSK